MAEDTKNFTFPINVPQQQLRQPWSLRSANNGGLASNRPVWTSGPQPIENPVESQVGSLAKFGLGIGAMGLLGKVAIRHDYKGFDLYGDILRSVEEMSPGRVFRTFQLSTLLSPLETASKQTRWISPQVLLSMQSTVEGQQWLAQLEGLTGKNLTDAGVFQFGVRFEQGKLYLGGTKRILLKHAGIIRNPTYGGAAFQSGYSRSVLKSFVDPKTFAQPISFMNKRGMAASEPFMFIGGRSKAQHMRRMLFGYGTTLVERMNQLARAPFEIEPFATIMSKAPILRNVQLAVKPTSGLRTLAKLTGKLGIAGYASYLAYQQLDHLTERSSIFDQTILGEGITAGAATVWTRSQVAISRAAEALGLHDYREHQEEVAPGSTKIQSLLAFPITGALGTLGYGYGKRFATQRSFYKTGVDFPTTSRMMQAVDEKFLESLYPKMSISASTKKLIDDPHTATQITQTLQKDQAGIIGKVARLIADRQNSGKMGAGLLKAFGKMTPAKVRLLLGLGGGLGLVAPFIPGAILPSTRPEELEAIYSGRQRVGIRKGRFWEFGRCLANSCLISTGYRGFVKAEHVVLNDKLIASDGSLCDIVQIYQRRYRGKILKITTGYDRNTYTELTPNHIVPVIKSSRNSYRYSQESQLTAYTLKKDRTVLEIEAGDIQVGDFVQIPIPSLNTNVSEVHCLDFIRFPVVVEDQKIYSTQRNWYSGNPQKSGKYFIPEKIELDEELGWFFGIFLAEGNISFRKKDGTPHFIETVHAVEEQTIRDRFLDIARRRFGVNGTKRFKKDGPKAKDGCWVVRLCSSVLAKLFCGMFFKEIYSSEDKDIPEIFLSASKEFKFGLIDGYQQGDGHLDRGRTVISGSRKSLIDKCSMILLTLGYYPTKPKKEIGAYIKKSGEYSVKHRLGWNYFQQDCDDVQGFVRVNDKLFCAVVEIAQEDYDDIVYDFEVDHPDHLLQAGTFLVHNSPYEGGRILYHRKHWYPRMLANAKNKSIYGEDMSPFERWYKENFTYELEQKHYKDRPYTISGKAFEDVPLVGPLLAATVGRFFKPEVLMHTEEWMRNSGQGEGGPLETLAMPSKFGYQPTPEALGGELGVGSPISPYGFKGVMGEQIYLMAEAVGLPGFTMSSIKETLTGEADFFSQEQQLESARRMYGNEREYWDLELGGGLGSSEIMRRLVPHRRRQIDLYNPIRNTMPDWLSGPGERSPDFQHGDAFVKIQDGEMRLPGVGYAALHPELEGVDPKDYPLIHRFAILSDISPYTERFKKIKNEVREAIKRNEMLESDIALYKERLEEIKARRVRKEFSPYRYRDRKLTAAEMMLAKANEQDKEENKASWFEQAVGSYWETLGHNIETPIEFLTPLSPGAKLLHMRTAVEDYKKTQVFGTTNAFWQAPIRDFMRPFFSSMAHALGSDSIPDTVEEMRETEEYFDVLKYMKYTALKRQAQEANDEKAAEEFEQQRRKTLFGLNPYSYDYSQLYGALPRRDRDYFKAFVEADAEERLEILDLIPENERRLYLARWQMQDANTLKKAIKTGNLDEEEVEMANAFFEDMYRKKDVEGMPTSKALWAEYLATKLDGESYSDWYRRTYLLAEALEGKSVPGADWVGWTYGVNLSDIKLKIVQDEGRNMFEYDMWPDQAKIVNRRPVVAEAAQELQATLQSPSDVRQRVRSLISGHGLNSSRIEVVPTQGPSVIELDIEEDRRDEILNRTSRGLLN